ncbi:hypothetical protein [Clostridium sporogenes]|uniref:hypothetical protein n=1 Tax=Clostridium sporogenes TaxID=1509 RepID=UPI001FAB9620|nr:hypothetical protein [Clostridium sporogenes]
MSVYGTQKLVIICIGQIIKKYRKIKAENISPTKLNFETIFTEEIENIVIYYENESYPPKRK